MRKTHFNLIFSQYLLELFSSIIYICHVVLRRGGEITINNLIFFEIMNKTYLKQFMNSIPMGIYKDTKDQIIEECHITEDIWVNWLSGRTRIPELAKPVINKIAGRNIFEEVGELHQTQNK
ncbi:hypothetical protein M2132_001782 [Dysgonomonas sp. PH5-45]|uniref:hypothetical protein n=1 Tax=unclassified Dysgonomonas TaxID=2630389 RepID=UPI0024762444|nr:MULTISPECIES: hypothetical protein [unclassified Dysgonomonas]MDH6355439.1 hypothetical protein [Dysgonomonas sp. PH5-45]MDH6388336.1 hypothetical protein [Dysgonomonas sp. PH5-37]